MEMIRLCEVATCEKSGNPCLDTTTQTNRDTMEVAIYSYCRKKRAGSPVTNPYTGICSLYWKLEHNRLKTYEDNEDLRNSERSRTPRIPRIEDIVDLV